MSNTAPILRSWAVSLAENTDLNFTVSAKGAAADFFADAHYKWPSFFNYQFVRHIPADSTQSIVVPARAGQLFVSARPISSMGSVDVSYQPLTAKSAFVSLICICLVLVFGYALISLCLLCRRTDWLVLQ